MRIYKYKFTYNIHLKEFSVQLKITTNYINWEYAYFSFDLRISQYHKGPVHN